MRERHGSIEESECGKKVIVTIVFGYKRTVEREAKRFKLEMR